MAGSTSKTKKKAKTVKKTAVKSGKKSLKTKSTVKKTASVKGNGKKKSTVSKVKAGKNNSGSINDKRTAVKSAVGLNGKPLGKTYLSDKDLKFFTELIVEQKTEILENARRLRESLIDENTGDYVGDHSTFSMHMAEQGSDEMEREKAYMFIQRDEKHLFYLENALERIAKKTYGLCISCGKPISKARLEAVPITSHCINCKQSISG